MWQGRTQGCTCHSVRATVCAATLGGRRGPQAVSSWGISGLYSHCIEDALLPPGAGRDLGAATAGSLLVPSQPSLQEAIPDRSHRRADFTYSSEAAISSMGAIQSGRENSSYLDIEFATEVSDFLKLF